VSGGDNELQPLSAILGSLCKGFQLQPPLKTQDFEETTVVLLNYSALATALHLGVALGNLLKQGEGKHIKVNG